MLGDFPRDAYHIQGFPCKDVLVGAEEVDERVFLFRGKRGANAHHFALGAAGVYEGLFGAFYRLKRPSRLLKVGHLFNDLLPNGRKLFLGDNCHGMFATLDLALIGMLEGGADGDDPTGPR